MAYQGHIPMKVPQGEYGRPAPSPAPVLDSSGSLEVDLVDIANRIWRRRMTVFATVVVGMSLSGVAALLVRPDYTSQARIMIETRRTEIVQSEAVLSDLTATEQVVETEIEFIRSGEIKERVARKLDLPTVMAGRAEENRQNSWAHKVSALLAQGGVAKLIPEAWANSLIPLDEPDPAPTLEDALGLLDKKLEARQIGNTAVMEISATDREPTLAQELVSTAVSEYLDAQVQWKSAATLMANNWLRVRIDELQSELTEKHRSLEYMRNAVGVVDNGGTSLLAERQKLANVRLQDARARRIQMQTELDEYERALREGGVADLASMFDSPVLAQLRVGEHGLEKDIAELSTIYGPRHPTLIDAQAKLATVRADIKDEAKRALGGVRSAFAAAHLAEQELARELGDLSHTAEDLGYKRTQLSVLQSEIDTMETLLESYLTRYKETREQEAIIRPDARVITAAVLPERANFPSRNLLLLAGLVASSALGVVLAFLRDVIDRTVRSVADAERSLNVPVIQALPAIPRRALGSTGPADYVIRNPASPYAESLRAMVTTLKAVARPNVTRRILVTSAIKGEGKSATAAALARLLQRSGYSVALIECDLRRPTLAKVLTCTSQPGLRQILEGEADISDALQRDPVSGMSFVAAGGASDNSLFLLQSATMKEFVHRLSTSHDILVLDSPPVIPLPDAQALSELVDATVLLCRWGSTSRDLSAAAVRMLMLWGNKAITVALSQVDSGRYLSYESSYVSGTAGYGYTHGGEAA